MTIHPTLMRYAELCAPNESLERRKSIATSALNNLKASFGDQQCIDYVTWSLMAAAIDHPDITEEDFLSVYENDWYEDDLLYSIVQEIIKPIDFSNKVLEDYL